MIDKMNKEKLLATLSLKHKFKFIVDAIGRSVKQKEQVTVIELFSKFPFRNEDVDLHNADITYRCMECTETNKLFFGVRVASNRGGEDKN